RRKPPTPAPAARRPRAAAASASPAPRPARSSGSFIRPRSDAMDTKEPMLTGLFRDRDSAERAYQSVSDRGYSRDDVTLVMSDETRRRHFTGATADGRETELGTKAAEGAGIGGAIGGSLGAIARAIAPGAQRESLSG